MRQNRLMLVIASVLTLGLTSLVFAQMMGGSQGHMSTGQSDSVSQSAPMGTGHMMGMMATNDSLMGQMSQYCRTMTADFDKLQSHFEKMMKLDDMTALKAEMQKHHDMMMTMRSQMRDQQQSCQNMMSMKTSMPSGGMHAMMSSAASGSASCAGPEHKR